MKALGCVAQTGLGLPAFVGDESYIEFLHPAAGQSSGTGGGEGLVLPPAAWTRNVPGTTTGRRWPVFFIVPQAMDICAAQRLLPLYEGDGWQWRSAMCTKMSYEQLENADLR